MKNENIENELNTNFKKGNGKKLFLFGIIGIIIVLLVIALVFFLKKGPKKAISNFVNGMNKQNSSKIIESLDFVGLRAWGYYFDEKDFSEKDYDKFIENYEEIDKKMDKDDLKEAQEYL